MRTVAPRPVCAYHAYMGMREDAVRRLMDITPGSVRALAFEAGLSEGLLRFIRAGERSATLETVRALAGASERLRDRHAEAARVLRDSLEEKEGEK